MSIEASQVAMEHNGTRLNDSYYLRIKNDKHEYRTKTS